MNNHLWNVLILRNVSTICAYHTGKAMVAICQQCRNSICELDLNKFQDYNGSGFGRSQAYDLCYFCYKEKQELNAAIIFACGLITSLFFIALSFTVLFILPSSSTQPGETITKNVPLTVLLGLLGILGFIACINYYFVYNKNRIKKASLRYSSEPVTRNTLISDQNKRNIQSTEAQNSFNQVNDVPVNKNDLITSTDVITCKFCGNNLTSDDIFCSTCGNRRN